ncbi:MAG: hypothetical protein Q4E18_01935 [Clostridia bacterium]|nr:hypothetical protein [Clostridia bacterium]
MKFIPSEALFYPVEAEALFTLVRVTGGVEMNAAKVHQGAGAKKAAPTWKTVLECGRLREKVPFAAGDCCYAFVRRVGDRRIIGGECRQGALGS